MLINQYLDSTYLKTPYQASITIDETRAIVQELIEEAIVYKFKLVMIRPDLVSFAKERISKTKNDLRIGTVIGFHQGTTSTEEKIKEAISAIDEGADELDFVLNYTAFINGQTAYVKNEILEGTNLCLTHEKTIKWIIEIAGLSNQQIVKIAQLIRNTVVENFSNEQAQDVYIKSSTGFYPTENGEPNGATIEGITLMLENAAPLQVKAAGGIKNYEDALKMIKLGVSRIGTSSAKILVTKGQTKEMY